MLTPAKTKKPFSLAQCVDATELEEGVLLKSTIPSNS